MRDELIKLFNEWNLQEYIPFHTEIAMLADYIIQNGWVKQASCEMIVCGDGEHVPFVCTHCCKTISWQTKQTAKYCPNCGAKIKEEA